MGEDIKHQSLWMLFLERCGHVGMIFLAKRLRNMFGTPMMLQRCQKY